MSDKYKNNIDLLTVMGFSPLENTVDIYSKKYPNHNDYSLSVDMNKKKIYYGDLIECDNKSTQNFEQSENWVVLECVNRLLEKGYKPQSIILEKTYPSGHGTSGRLDICVKRADESEHLLIECKTYGKEFDKEFTSMKKDGGQLFTYFKFSNKPDIIMLYASHLNANTIEYKNEIIKVEEDYRSGNVKDFYEKWNKLTKNNGVFDNWVNPYSFISKALTKESLKRISEGESSFIFNRFLEILRHNVVSDKPNAFNKIFTLFLCKVYDEKTTRNSEELKFQWLEGIDNDVSFQLRLTDLYKNGMKEFLEKDVTDFSKDDFEKKYKCLDDKTKKALLEEFEKIRLEKNNEFAIKEVFDNQSFTENAKIVKEVVELLQEYQLRYNKREQYLSDFFEMLLTTGLKQESGQFFTPVPVARFIIKSIPLDQIITEKLEHGERNQLLPYVMDFAAGSGHFLTEGMHEIQAILNKQVAGNYISDTAKKIKTWKTDHFDWATLYVYGVEKDYRLVKVGKVGCYLHGDGLANVILSDGLASFATTKEYKGILKHTDTEFPMENKQFDIVISNPPYSVASFKNTAREYYTEKDFELYEKLTDNSSEIECLFVERTKQLLKDGGIAGIILPSSILSNTGIYTKTREIILKYFEIIAIAELGSNTFMATGTNTVILFLRRRNNYDSINICKSVEKVFSNHQDFTINGIERPVAKYLRTAWPDISFDDYVSLLQKNPNQVVKEQEIYQEYQKKIKLKKGEEKLAKILSIEQEKLFYFVLTSPQKVVIVKTGTKKEEKQFLGYEFSHRRGSEGIHPIQRGRLIDECTSLFDAETFDNPQKASTYIYKAFTGDYSCEIDASLQDNIMRANLADLMNFDRTDFEKSISLNIKKEIVEKNSFIYSVNKKYEQKTILEVTEKLFAGGDMPKTYSSNRSDEFRYPIFGNGVTKKGLNGYASDYKVNKPCVTISARGTLGYCELRTKPFIPVVRLIVAIPNDKIDAKYFKCILSLIQFNNTGATIPQLTVPNVRNIKIPLPPKDIQEKIVAEIEALEKQEREAKKKIENFNNKIDEKVNNIFTANYPQKALGLIAEIKNGGTPSTTKPEYWNGNISWATLVDTKEKYLTKTARKISEEGLLHSSAVLLPINTIVFSSRATIGDISILKIQASTNQGYKNFVCNSKQINYEFLYYILKHESHSIEDLASGMTYKEISKSQIEEIKIPLPSPAEQKKIVAQILKIENNITELKNQLAIIPQQKEAILKKYLN